MRFTRILVLGVAVVGIMALSANAADVNLYTEAWAIDCDPLSATPARYLLGPCEVPEGEEPPPSDYCVVLPLTSGECGEPSAKAMYEIFFQVAVGVDPTGVHAQGNKGLATIVYDVMPNECMTCGCPEVYLNAMQDAKSGWSEATDGSGVPDVLKDVTKGMYYVDDATTVYAGYNGGWGFDNAGFPTGGNTETIQEIHGAGMLAPLAWEADANTLYPGLQPYVRQGVGHGIYTFPLADPGVGGLQGGFGQDLSNLGNIVQGDGSWLMQEGTIPCHDYEQVCTYGWDVLPTNAAVYSPTCDYNFDVGAGFRLMVDPADMAGDSFCFTIIPEPASMCLLLIGGLALIRRRR